MTCNIIIFQSSEDKQNKMIWSLETDCISSAIATIMLHNKVVQNSVAYDIHGFSLGHLWIGWELADLVWTQLALVLTSAWVQICSTCLSSCLDQQVSSGARSSHSRGRNTRGETGNMWCLLRPRLRIGIHRCLQQSIGQSKPKSLGREMYSTSNGRNCKVICRRVSKGLGAIM